MFRPLGFWPLKLLLLLQLTQEPTFNGRAKRCNRILDRTCSNSHWTPSASLIAPPSAAAEGIATSSKALLEEVRDHERELDSLDRDIDDLVTTTITKVGDEEARTLLACMKFGISLERIGDLLLSFVNRAESVSAHMEHDDIRDLTVMSSQLEKMLADVEVAFRTRSLDKAVSVLRADTEIDRLRNVITFRHLEPTEGMRRLESFHVLFMAQEIRTLRRPREEHGGRGLPPGQRTHGAPRAARLRSPGGAALSGSHEEQAVSEGAAEHFL